MMPGENTPPEKNPGACDICGEWDVDLLGGVCHKLVCREMVRRSADPDLQDELAADGQMLGCGS